jgi:LemA protein
MNNQSISKFLNLKVILGVVVLIIVLFAFNSYNKLIVTSENVDSKWAQVEVVLQRRFDLIPNLESTVKGITKQENEVFGMIADARTRYAGAASVNDKAAAASQYESAIGRLLVITENYPNLQSSQAFKDLMTQLEGTENRIAVERKNYNDSVQQFNLVIKRFPTNLFSKLFGFEAKTYLEVSEEAQQNPQVNF